MSTSFPPNSDSDPDQTPVHVVTRTKRLLLRAPTAGDLDSAMRIHLDPRTNRFNASSRTPQEVQALLGFWVEHWRHFGFGYWAVARNEAPQHVIGYGGIVRKQVGPHHGLNLYFRFEPEAWGRGLATEMAQAALALAFEQRTEPEVLGLVYVVNEPSRRALERVGMRCRQTLDEGPDLPPSLIYAITADEYRSQRRMQPTP